jgi:hypothetical protein
MLAGLLKWPQATFASAVVMNKEAGTVKVRPRRRGMAGSRARKGKMRGRSLLKVGRSSF